MTALEKFIRRLRVEGGHQKPSLFLIWHVRVVTNRGLAVMAVTVTVSSKAFDYRRSWQPTLSIIQPTSRGVAPGAEYAAGTPLPRR